MHSVGADADPGDDALPRDGWYVCSVMNCGLRFSRISNLNRHRQTQHQIPQEYYLRTKDVLVAGEIHNKIRMHQTLDELIPLLQRLGFICSY